MYSNFTDGISVKQTDISTIREPHPNFQNIHRDKKVVTLDNGNKVNVDYYNRHRVREDLIDTFPSGKPKNAREFAGKEMPLPAHLSSKYGDSIPFTESGYPDFERIMKDNNIDTMTIDNFSMSGNSSLDIANANEVIHGYCSKNPVGFEDYTWHHLLDGKTMIFVPQDLHNYVKHHGGDAITRVAN